MTKGEQARLTAWRLKVLQHAADQQNVARVCRWFGISRQSFYKWKRRHAEHGDANWEFAVSGPIRTWKTFRSLETLGRPAVSGSWSATERQVPIATSPASLMHRRGSQ